MPLTDTAIRNAKPGATPFKISDGGGLHLLVQPNGARLWRLAYRFAGKQKTLALTTALKGVLKPKGRERHHTSMPREELTIFLRSLDTYDFPGALLGNARYAR